MLAVGFAASGTDFLKFDSIKIMRIGIASVTTQTTMVRMAELRTGSASVSTSILLPQMATKILLTRTASPSRIAIVAQAE